jgi:hypothetical protein
MIKLKIENYTNFYKNKSMRGKQMNQNKRLELKKKLYAIYAAGLNEATYYQATKLISDVVRFMEEVDP